MEQAVKAVEKHSRMRRASPVPGMARKLSELAAQIEQTVRLEAERDRKDDGRVRAILNTATGGAIERMIRSMRLDERDRDYLRSKVWHV